MTGSHWKKTGGYLKGWSTISPHKILILLIYLSITAKLCYKVIAVTESYGFAPQAVGGFALVLMNYCQAIHWSCIK